MILVNQAMRGNKEKDLEANVGPQSPRGGDKKGAKFNFGGFLKKIPLPVNKRTTEETRVETEGQGNNAEFSLSPTAMSSPSEMVGLGSSGGNIIEENSNYTHEIISVGDPSRTQQRYATFTSKCISLENSELTSQIDSDEQSLDGPQDSVFTQDSRPPPVSLGQKNMKKKSQNPKSRVNNNQSVTSVIDNPDGRGEVFENYQHFDNFEAYKKELAEEEEEEEEEDVIEYLSESESDLNVNPHQEENANDYKVGGYHPVSKGEVYFSRDFPNREYIILRKLGWGHFSTVWLAKCRYNRELTSGVSQNTVVDTDDHYVAIKFVKSNDNYMEAAEDEIKLLKTLAKPLVYGKHLEEQNQKYFENYKSNSRNQPVGHPGYKHIMRLLDDFEVTGPNGKHICMVFEILGENVLNLIFKSKTISKDLKHCSKSPTERKDMRPENNKNFKLFKSKLSLGLINNPKKELTTDVSMGCVKNNSSDSLTKLIEVQKTYGGIPLTLVKQIVKQMFLAVDYMHHCGIIHTDLKPENILIEIKDINNVIKVIENEKITKFNAKYKNRKDSSLSTVNINTDKMGLNRANSTNLTTRKDSVGYGSYRKSRNSVCGKCDSPVRTSKPLSSSINTDTKFQEISFNSSGNSSRQDSICKINDGGISPTNKKVLKPKQDNNDKELISIKIADFGNATFSHYHFTNQIQTRQYRAPEILLKHKTWGASADIWSIGCIIFELITGDYLFDPHNGNNFDKDEDHMAQIIELLGEFPSPAYLSNCELTSTFFDKDSAGEYSLRNISKLKYWSLHDVLVQKYKFDENDINLKLINDLILKCLTYDLTERYDCKSLANHPWLKNDIDLVNFDFESSTNLPKDHSDVPGFTS